MEPDRLVTRTYKTSLTIAVLLLFTTLTGAVVLAIITSEREGEREESFAATLTAVFSAAQNTVAAHATPPTPAPTVQPGEYPFAAEPPGPRYSRAELPASQVVHGLVLDEAGEPVDRYSVTVWGDYTPARTLETGELVGLGPGRWALTLEGQVNRRVWVQLMAAGRYLSAPVEIVFEESNAERSAAEVVFHQIRPLT
ncbi:MAG TPA: hypothetical protein PKD46_03580 [Aggregatilineaceae bacterium]|nr:hypothetical protein [Anaerolineae bacterium]HMM27346.1 hypothetical protein [Aggregatilineaceae bacterium]